MANDQVKVTITAEDATRSAFRSVESSLRGLQGSAASALAGLGALGAGLSVAGLVTGLRTTVDSMDALNDASDRTGSSVEELSALLNTLSPYGATLDQITDATGKLARAMAGADDETRGAGAAFAALGISTRDSAGNLRPTVDVLDDVAKALTQYEDGTNKTVLAQTIFGKTGAALLPLLKDLANAQKANASVTTEQAAAAEAFNVQLGVVLRNLDALKVQLAGPVITALNGIIERFNAAGNSAENFYNRLRLAFQPEREIGRLEGDVASLEKRLAGLNERLADSRLDGFLRSRTRSEIADVTAQLERARRALADAAPVRSILQRNDPALRAQEDRGFTPGLGAAPSVPTAGASGAVRATVDAYAELDALIRQADIDDALKQQAKAAKELADQLERAADAALARVAANDRAEQDADSGIRRDIEAIQDAIDPTRALYRELERVRDLAALLPRDVVNARQAQILSQIDGILGGEVPKQIKDANDAARELGLTFTSAFEDAIVGGKKFSDVLKGLEADILRIIVRRAITEPLANFITGGLSTLFGGGKAAGGPVSAGTAYLVGEKGPELIVPRSAGTVVPNRALGGSVTIINNIDSRADRSAISADIQRSQLASLAMLQDMRARGKVSA